MEEEKKSRLLLVAAAFVILAALMAFKIIDSPKMSGLPAVQVSLTTTQASQQSISSDVVNINTADKEELMTLDKIGEMKAEAIIEYREKNGNFRTIEEITLVDGIGDTILRLNKDRITV